MVIWKTKKCNNNENNCVVQIYFTFVCVRSAEIETNCLNLFIRKKGRIF